MAEKATIYKANVTLSDTDRHYYSELNLTIALHPSETIERMMARLLAYCYHANDNLSFTRGLSSVEEPDLWLKSDDGRILEWIEVGQPAPDRLKKASGQSVSVKVYTYGRGMDVWWNTNANAIKALPKVAIQYFSNDELAALAQLAEKTMNLTVTIAEAIAYIDSGDKSISVSPRPML